MFHIAAGIILAYAVISLLSRISGTGCLMTIVILLLIGSCMAHH